MGTKRVLLFIAEDVKWGQNVFYCSQRKSHRGDKSCSTVHSGRRKVGTKRVLLFTAEDVEWGQSVFYCSQRKT